MKMPRILIVEDNPHMLSCLNVALQQYDFIPILASDGEQALRALPVMPVDLAILDYRLPGRISGMELARLIKRRDAGVPVILITAHSSEELAIETLEVGIDEYFPKPLVIKDLVLSIRRLLASRGFSLLPDAAGRTDNLPELIDEHRLVGAAAPIQAIKAYIRKVAATDSSVLITGETGTGKELVAELIHKNSRRLRSPLVCLNCAAIPESLTESELFGYERGAFTGAYATYAGKLKQADGGTVFLDEIGDMPLSGQAKLLRLLDTKTVQPIGGRKEVTIDLRVIAATNQNLEDLIAVGKFRQDLYYRLNVAHISMPPLRTRREDIPLLLRHFISELNTRFAKHVCGVSPELVESLLQYGWPGNVRELRNITEVCMMDLDAGMIDLTHIPTQYRNKLPGYHADEKDAIMQALYATKWNKSQAAQQLHWSRMTLYRKLAKYHILTSRRDITHDPSGMSDTTL